jgi:hypothetical protein
LEVGITGHNFGRGPSKNHFSKVAKNTKRRDEIKKKILL